MIVFSLPKEEKTSLEKIQQLNTIDRIRNHHSKSENVFQYRTLSRSVRHCQTRSLSSSFDAVSLYHTVSRAEKHYFTASYESVMILTILHHIHVVLGLGFVSLIWGTGGVRAWVYLPPHNIRA